MYEDLVVGAVVGSCWAWLAPVCLHDPTALHRSTTAPHHSTTAPHHPTTAPPHHPSPHYRTAPLLSFFHVFPTYHPIRAVPLSLDHSRNLLHQNVMGGSATSNFFVRFDRWMCSTPWTFSCASARASARWSRLDKFRSKVSSGHMFELSLADGDRLV